MKKYQQGKITELLESISETPLKECLLINEGASQQVEDKDEEDLFSRKIRRSINKVLRKIKPVEVAKIYQLGDRSQLYVLS